MAQASGPAAAVEGALDAFTAAARVGDCVQVSQALRELTVGRQGQEGAQGEGQNLGARPEAPVTINDLQVEGAPLLVWAAEKSDVPPCVVRLLLDEGAHVDIIDDHHLETALFKAIKRRSEELVELLLERSADAGSFNRLERSPLMVASTEGHLPIVRRLLAGKTVSVHDANCRLQTALRCAVSAGHAEVARVLMRDYGADPTFCAGRCEPKAATEGADSEAHRQCFEMIKAVRSVTPTFISAVHGGDVKEVERLLGQGGWGLVNALYLEGRNSPLMVAAERGDMPMAEMLMHHGARPELEQDSNPSSSATALSLATKGGHEDMVKRLLAKGEWAPDGEALKEALWQACQHGRVALLAEYLSRVPYEEKTWVEGLERAGKGQHPQCFDLLLQHAEQDNRRALIETLIKSKWLSELEDGSEPFNCVVLSCLQHVGPCEPDLAQPHWFKVAQMACDPSQRFPALKQLLEQGVNKQEAIMYALSSVLNGDGLSFGIAWEDCLLRARYLLATGMRCGKIEPRSVFSYGWASRGRQWPTSVFRTLLDSGMCSLSTGGVEQDGLAAMARSGKLEALGLLLESGLKFNDRARREALFVAAEAGREDAVALLLEHGVKARSFFFSHRYSCSSSFDDVGGRAVIQACSGGHRGIVRRLLEWGGVFARYRDVIKGTTALTKCLEKGDWEGAMLLLESGAELESAIERCATPADAMEVDEAAPSVQAAVWNSMVEDIMAALQSVEREDVVTAELSRLGARGGACVLNALDRRRGLTVLMIASLKGHVQVVKYLLEGCGVDPDICGRGGSALCHACVGGSAEVVQLLLGAGADAMITDASGKTPFDLACTHGHDAAARLVLPRHESQVAQATKEEAEEPRASRMKEILRHACGRATWASCRCSLRIARRASQWRTWWRHRREATWRW